jgi:hypothetical protein
LPDQLERPCRRPVAPNGRAGNSKGIVAHIAVSAAHEPIAGVQDGIVKDTLAAVSSDHPGGGSRRPNRRRASSAETATGLPYVSETGIKLC